ncbi:MAG: ArsB/NhaD family transporter [Negativicoccus succinicivorans]|uniref:Na+/H+ antiporter NhaD/arsenite permease-like protein n=2 Tax=Negativicoccus succinicivorans TaxID=620903 RepID=A0A841R3R9_9FIRM|nr:Na+/H+ antiporter NhaD/arsenite permease-like protein [Negativicoccus succinicivorans]MBS5890165.1 ArsB/NhaD family transporter [Negativicoccus succinicivorans]MBS5917486.1 ArsB/NhaD family transporter [Negativicoccus succinicivorans]
MSEKWPRTIVSLVGGMTMILVGFVTQEMAITRFIDFNTLGLLIGMMMIVAVVKKTGMFEAFAIWAVKLTQGRSLLLMLMFAFLTAISAAFLDVVTAVLLIAPITISLTKFLRLNAYPFLIMEILASNIGGTGTMVGDPPNVMIGSAVGLTFMDFVTNTGPIAMFVLLLCVPTLLLVFRKELKHEPFEKSLLDKLDPKKQIADWRLFHISLTVLVLTVFGFAIHNLIGFETATIALTGAIAMMVFTGETPEEALSGVDWSTIFFFIGLFVLVGGIEATGVIGWVAKWAVEQTQGNIEMTSSLILWISALASAFVDNIPFTATMIPIIKEMENVMGLDPNVLWWSLSIGACYGGNGTIIGSSPGVIIAALAAQNGYDMSFKKYFIVGFPMMLFTVFVGQVYIWLRYF